MEGKTDLTSFSPDEHFDELVFVRLIRDDDVFEIYRLDFSSEDLKNISVNKNQKASDQQEEKRRPRFSVLNKLIVPNGIEPVALFSCRARTLETKQKEGEGRMLFLHLQKKRRAAAKKGEKSYEQKRYEVCIIFCRCRRH